MSEYQMWPPIAPGMPQGVREVFWWCHAEHSGLRRKARMCLELWGDQATVDLLNRTAPMFFRDACWALFDDLHLTISRLTDPPNTGKKENLVFERLIDLVEKDQPQNAVLASALKADLQAARDKAGAIREKRNSMIGHNDLSTHIDGKRVLLRTGVATLKAILGSFDALLNKIQTSYGGDPIPVDFLESGHDATRLVERLREAENMRHPKAGE